MGSPPTYLGCHFTLPPNLGRLTDYLLFHLNNHLIDDCFYLLVRLPYVSVNALIETHPGSWILVAGPRTIRVAMLVACLQERCAVNVLSCGNQFICYPGSLSEARNYIG